VGDIRLKVNSNGKRLEKKDSKKIDTSSFIEITQAGINAVRKGGLPPLNVLPFNVESKAD